ncbi:MAG TPA: hypothetical protein VGU20_20715 [Stellaceae bacterium]|nr:hypothetical protein [Stellaceae bacterium]
MMSFTLMAFAELPWHRALGLTFRRHSPPEQGRAYLTRGVNIGMPRDGR